MDGHFAGFYGHANLTSSPIMRGKNDEIDTPRLPTYNAALKEIIFMFGLGTTELIVILVILLLLFGSSRLPGLAKGMGESIRNFKKAVNDDKEELEEKKNAI